MKVLIAAAAAAALALSSLPAAAGPGTIVDVASNAKVFKTLLAAATAAGLADELDEVDGLTVFAPTDKAFEGLPAGTVENLLKPENRGTLRAIIAYHIVPARVFSHQIPHRAKLVETLNGCERVRTKRTFRGVTVDGARVTKANIVATNGVVHIIDKVLLPARACP